MPVTLLQGDDLPYNIFSSLGEYGLLILAFLTYEDGNAFRATCKEARTAVAEFPWMDSKTRINGSLKLWRTCFRNAKAANIYDRKNLTDVDFIYLKGIHTLNMGYCRQITDAAFVHLKGIHTLDMSYCRQITDAAFVHLKGIHALDIRDCNKITKKGYAHLRGIHTLIMHHGIGKSGITDKAFAHLEGIHTLTMDQYSRYPDRRPYRNKVYRSRITDKAFVHLKGIHTLNMIYCKTITDAAFVHLKGIHTLNMSHCNVTDAALVHLNGIHTLHMQKCKNITGTGFVHLKGIHTLDVGYHGKYSNSYVSQFEFIGMKVLGYSFDKEYKCYYDMLRKKLTDGTNVEITKFYFPLKHFNHKSLF